MDLVSMLVLAGGLGLLGFVEPCSAGSHFLFIKTLDRLNPRQKMIQTLFFVVTRALLMAGLGVVAVFIGQQFQGIQVGLWIALGSIYTLLGLAYLGGVSGQMSSWLKHHLPQMSPATGGIGLGIIFGINIPACAAPLLAILLGSATTSSAAGSGAVGGILALLVFGLALSVPLVAAIFTRRGRNWLNSITRFSAAMPRLTGLLLVVFGLSSVGLALHGAAV